MGRVKSKSLFVVCTLVLLFGIVPAVLGDWNPGDPHKMHWPQLPDLTETGMDVYATLDMTGMKPRLILADDFECAASGPVLDIHIWGSWYQDRLPQDNPNQVVFTLSLHGNIPAEQSSTGYSMPGPPLWWKEFHPGQFMVRQYAVIPEGEWWYEPFPGGNVIWPGDHICWQYNFDIDPGEFTQEAGEIYWLNVQARPLAEYTWFGWKTTSREWHWMDDACWVIGQEPFNGIWNKLTYPGMHRYQGETVDLAFVITGEEEPEEFEYGDAPEQGIAYPSLCVTGLFPTCEKVGPAGWIQHNNFGGWFGLGFDLELDGNAGLCLQHPMNCFPPYDQDECFQDGDAGLLFPVSYTIQGPAGAEKVVLCPGAGGVNPSLGTVCTMAKWGRNVDIDVHNMMPDHEPYVEAYVNVLMDFNRNGKWGDTPPPCPDGTVADEWVLKNFLIRPKYIGPLSGLNPPDFLIGPYPGHVWTRFTITERPIPEPPLYPPWDGSGFFEDGESEDYLLLIDPVQKTYECDWDESMEHKMHWPQLPDLEPTGLDVDMFPTEPDLPLTGSLGDDFECSQTGKITDIHLWASFPGDCLPAAGVEGLHFKLAIHADIPDPDPLNPETWSMPGKELWSRDFEPCQYTVRQITDSNIEGWYDPKTGVYTMPDHFQCYQYNFCIDEDEAYSQMEGRIYWLVVTYIPGEGDSNFGWKTSGSKHFLDDGVWWNNNPDATRPFGWNPLKYPDGHEYQGETMDLAFVITGVPELDFGDAPDSPFAPGYPTLLANSGANHIIAGPWMGDNTDIPDGEPDGQPTPAATGDDLDGNDDEDGLPFLTLTAGQSVTFNLEVNGASAAGAVVEIWIDYNQNNNWEHPAELAYSNTLLNGVHNITINVPAGALPGTTFARARISSAGTNSPKDQAADGEVEDTKVEIKEPPPELDFGDAPDPTYPTKLINGGANHIIVPGVFLGQQIDAELDGQPTIGANGDDANNLDDEDGVTFLSPIIPGTTVDVNVVASVNGFLFAWFDLNADGDWNDAGENIFAGPGLIAGGNALQFNIPLAAPVGSTTYSRWRFVQTVVAGLSYRGQALDGEVEDYIHKIKERPPKARFVKHSKWSQPPIELDPSSEIPVFCGWDEVSWVWAPEDPPRQFQFCPPKVADDFRCIGDMPITSIHWWGSHYGWEGQEPGTTPPQPPIGWHISFWSNIPDPDPGDPATFSQPDKPLKWFTVDADRVKVEEVGTDDFHHIHPNDICYQYNLTLEPNDYFWQGEHLDKTKDSVFWLSIQAIYPTGADPIYEWGWKTRPWHWMDDAVRKTVVDDPGGGPPLCIWEPIKDPRYGKSFDLAFELDTDPNWIKWEQHFTGIRDWPHYEDELSFATVETFMEYKWLQKPDLSPDGMDVDATDDAWRPQLLADDFRCTESGPIDRIHIWGSWFHDRPPGGDANMVAFTLSIHADIPDPDGDGPLYSMPGQLLWRRDFYPHDFEVFLYARINEGWYVPCAEPPLYDPFADTECWMYMFPIPPSEAYVQEQGTIYWLDVQAQPMLDPRDPLELVTRFGWKNTNLDNGHYDDAVWAAGTEEDFSGIPTHGPWQEMRYPLGHPWEGQSVDMAFEIFTHGATKWVQPPEREDILSIDIDATRDEIWQPQLLADDFECITNEAITDIHVWGSWYHDFLPYGDPGMVRFKLSIHKDIPDPDGPDGPRYSMPGDLLWEKWFEPGEFDVSIFAEGLQEGYYVPCSEPPYYEYAGDSICWQYDFYINESEAYVQEGTEDEPVVYWLNVQAVPLTPPDQPIEPIRPRFGWKTTDPGSQWNDDAVWAIGTEELHGPWQELRHPETNESLDLAFAITSGTQEELVIHRRVADDWDCRHLWPVTALSWWGSYDGFNYYACHGQQMDPPDKPDYFLLSIWTDVRPTADEPYSHPGKQIWEYKAKEYNEVLVGYDKHPHDPAGGATGPPREAVFRYSVQIPDPNDWFVQEDVNGIYWLSVLAVYEKPLWDIMHPWGWTNHKCTAWEPEGLTELAHWKLNELSGLIAPDSSGNGNDGTLTPLIGGPTWASGKICGGALEFGDGNDYVDCGNDPIFDLTDEITLSAWINIDSVPWSWSTIVSKGDTAWRLSTDKLSTRIHFAVTGGAVGYYGVNSINAVPTGEWHHVCGTYDGSDIRIYIDGVLDNNNLYVGNITTNTFNVFIGGNSEMPLEGYRSWDGLIDDVRIYDKGLSASKVKALTRMGMNDDAVEGYLDSASTEPNKWNWNALYDQTGRTEDMSFILYTRPCFPFTDPNYAEWVKYGRPDCWCYARQCHGDADGIKYGDAWTGYYYVGTPDLGVVAAAWMVKEPPFASPPYPNGIVDVPNGICADFDHEQYGDAWTGYYRVGTPDLGILANAWMAKEIPFNDPLHPFYPNGVPGDCVPDPVEP